MTTKLGDTTALRGFAYYVAKATEPNENTEKCPQENPQQLDALLQELRVYKGLQEKVLYQELLEVRLLACS